MFVSFAVCQTKLATESLDRLFFFFCVFPVKTYEGLPIQVVYTSCLRCTAVSYDCRTSPVFVFCFFANRLRFPSHFSTFLNRLFIAWRVRLALLPYVDLAIRFLYSAKPAWYVTIDSTVTSRTICFMLYQVLKYVRSSNILRST